MEIDITRLLPKFIIRDKNGYALSKAIEAGMQMACDVIESGKDLIFDISTMPEWRLDELSGEIGLLYDYSAPVSIKRKWLADAWKSFRYAGTPYAIKQYLGPYFDKVEVYDNLSEPYHFIVATEGSRTPENAAWAINAIEQSKNLRSIFDGLAVGMSGNMALTAEGYSIRSVLDEFILDESTLS